MPSNRTPTTGIDESLANDWEELRGSYVPPFQISELYPPLDVRIGCLPDRTNVFEAYAQGGMLQMPNPLSEMFAEKRAKKVKLDKNLEKQVRELTEKNKQLQPRLNASRKEVEELKARVKYLENAIDELEKDKNV